ncbi:hypothetical protein HPB50_013223 [Hyalomma asiaticum]|uniref:Uncharacterized protein n=1 Tax=Hyalomma asiaticum TaxID=266040 RepID=A0ACB7TNI0_HYAAI|nr:hypothetical protein HPB50_013223 [Hyalomma asiaticum]
MKPKSSTEQAPTVHRPETGRCYFAGPRPRDRNRGPAAETSAARLRGSNSSPDASRARRGESLPAGGANHGRDAGDVSSIEVRSQRRS